MSRIRVIVLLLGAVVVACTASEETPTEVLREQIETPPTAAVDTATPTAQVSDATSTAQATSEESASPPPPEITTTSTPVQSDSWIPPGAALVYARGEGERVGVYALDGDGGELSVLADGGDQVSISPDGRWLGYVLWREDGYSTLVLHDAASGQRREIEPDTRSGMVRFLFDPGASRLAYVDLGTVMGGRVPWSLVIADLETEMSARYDAVMADIDARPLPGVPVAWSKAGSREHIILDTFLPYTESGWMGVWAVPLPAGSVSGLLASLLPREIVPGGAYGSQAVLAQDGRNVAYLARDPEYVPDNYAPEFYDLAVNRLEIASLDDGSRHALVEASDGSAFARAVAWSPSSDRLLFAQGTYEGEHLSALVLRSTDLDSSVVTYGPVDVPSPGELMDIIWCSPAVAYFVIWDGQDGLEKLISFDLNTGATREFAADRRLDIVTCAP